MTAITKYLSPNKPSVFLGMDKGKTVNVCHIGFVESAEVDLDLILASVKMRHRKVLKGVFNSSNKSVIRESAELLEIEDLTKLDTETIMACKTEDLCESMPKNTLLFFLSQDQEWLVVGHCDVFALSSPIPAVTAFKKYYEAYYPKEVVEYAFRDPNCVKRVYDVEEANNTTDYFFEPLFVDSDVIEHLILPNEPNSVPVNEAA